MPPKSKFTKEQVIQAAFQIVREEGMDYLTARSLGEKLNSSARPIFTLFDNMKEVQKEVIKEAKKVYTSYLDEGLNEIKPFKGVGKAYIKFATNEPQLFTLLFMKEVDNIPNCQTALLLLEDNYEKIIESIQDDYHFDREKALSLYLHLWIYTHGIAVMIVTKVCKFSGKEISDMLTEVNMSLIKKMKEEENSLHD